VPSEILSKPGKLSDIEIKLIQSHSSAGYEMIRKVKLPDYLGKTILEHHESCDGSGYPNGLKDKDIWIVSKIIVVADVVEAMMSHRPYRPTLGLDAAMTEITGKADILYDKKVATACYALMVKEEYEIEDKEYKSRMI
jgi:HD-GYP domain-containing protein (c-di-GMP phosphodiesterase class II)